MAFLTLCVPHIGCQWVTAYLEKDSYYFFFLSMLASQQYTCEVDNPISMFLFLQLFHKSSSNKTPIALPPIWSCFPLVKGECGGELKLGAPLFFGHTHIKMPPVTIPKLDFFLFFSIYYYYFFLFGCSCEGGCPSPRSCWAYPGAGPDWDRYQVTLFLTNS